MQCRPESLLYMLRKMEIKLFRKMAGGDQWLGSNF